MKKIIGFIGLVILAAVRPSIAQHAKFDNKPAVIESVPYDLEFVGTGDVNGDGRTDVAGAATSISDPDKRDIYLWFQDAAGQLKPSQKFRYSKTKPATSFAIADLYKDGTADVLVGVGGFLHIYSWINNNLVLTDSLLTIGNVSYYAVDGITTGDFDSDGLTDIGICHRGGNRITVIYHQSEGNKWDIRNYTITTDFGHVVGGRWGNLQQDALVYLNGKSGPNPVTVMTFAKNRSLQNKYDLQIPVSATTPPSPHGAAIVRKGQGKPNELWISHGGNKPESKVSIWRGLQALPDVTTLVYDVPEAIQADNLDCDDDDEPVLLHGGWSTASIFIDTIERYHTLPYTSHYQQDGLALGDINGDTRKDICIASRNQGLIIFYNITSPCWPASVSTALPAQQCSLYPNPASNQLTVTFDGNAALQITDVRGQLLLNTTFQQKTTIDIGAWPAGIYFASIKGENGFTINKKFIRE